MARFRKPFFRASRGVWYVQLNGKQTNLGPDRDQAFSAYHQLMAARTVLRPGTPQMESRGGNPFDSALVVVLVDKFLDFVQKNRAADTYRWYKDRLNRFCQVIPASLQINDLRIFHVQEWIDSQTKLASGSKRNLCRSVMTAMQWAVKQGHISKSPLACMEKPRAGRREQVVTPAEYERLLTLTRDEAFRDLLSVTWECGPRPQETLRVEARHVDLANGRWNFPASEAKGRSFATPTASRGLPTRSTAAFKHSKRNSGRTSAFTRSATRLRPGLWSAASTA